MSCRRCGPAAKTGYFLRHFSHDNRLPLRSFEVAAHRRSLAYSFPGNVCELRAVVELATVLAEGKHIRAADFPPLLSSPAAHALPLASLGNEPGLSLRK